KQLRVRRADLRAVAAEQHPGAAARDPRDAGQGRDDRLVHEVAGGALRTGLRRRVAQSVTEPIAFAERDATRLRDPGAVRFTGAARLWATLRGSPTAFLTGSYAVVVAISERASREVILDGSDVLRATNESLDVFLSGGDPYAHVLQSTVPPGSPFVYPPGEF